MTIQRKVRCIHADSLECFLAAALKYGCRHITKHYKDYTCEMDFCIKAQKHFTYCVGIRRQKKCNSTKKEQL